MAATGAVGRSGVKTSHPCSICRFRQFYPLRAIVLRFLSKQSAA
ncbi:hypothetical protein D8I24_5851 [Cupriavidus necator H850]|nr:hypothetical protein D8I24_5851 [Cupriavidus necator H850]